MHVHRSKFKPGSDKSVPVSSAANAAVQSEGGRSRGTVDGSSSVVTPAGAATSTGGSSSAGQPSDEGEGGRVSSGSGSGSKQNSSSDSYNKATAATTPVGEDFSRLREPLLEM